MKKYYIYLKIYNVKKSNNEKLLYYIESILLDKGFDLNKFIKFFKKNNFYLKIKIKV